MNKRFILFLLLLCAEKIYAKDQPDHTYRRIAKLSMSGDEGAQIQAAREFNLSDPDTSTFLLTKIQSKMPLQSDERAPRSVLTILLKTQPENCFEWILDKMNDMTSYGNLCVANTIDELDYRECYKVLFIQMNDEREVLLNRREPPPGPCWNERVCDFAYNSVIRMLRRKEQMPATLLTKIGCYTPLVERNTNINLLKAWWIKESEVFLQEKKSLAETRPSISSKLQALQESHSRP